MLRCRELVELVTDYLERALPPELEGEVREHLEECVGCLRLLNQTLATVQLLGHLHDE